MPINNSGSFFNNFQNGFNFIHPNQNDLQKIDLNPINKVVPPQLQQENKQQNTLLNVLSNTQNQINTSMKELAALTEQQAVNMAKDLLNFPKEFSQLITQLTTKAQLTNQQTALLLLASNMNLSQISQFLETNSKDAMSNLYKMVASYNQLGVAMKNEQLSHITKLISIVSAASSSDVQSLKTAMLMYLPWLPLTDPNAFKLEIASKNSNDETLIGLDSVGVLLSTKNYGNIQAQILKTEADGIKIEVISSETFPLKVFVDLMQKESKRYSININFDLAVKPEFNREKIEKTQTEVFLNTSPGVNPFLLLISNALIKNIHDIDMNETTKWQDKERTENDKN